METTLCCTSSLKHVTTASAAQQQQASSDRRTRTSPARTKFPIADKEESSSDSAANDDINHYDGDYPGDEVNVHDQSVSNNDTGNSREFRILNESSFNTEKQDDCGDLMADIDRAPNTMNERIDDQRYGRNKHEANERPNDTFNDIYDGNFRDDASAVASVAPSEASMNVLMRYMGCSSTPYMKVPNTNGSIKEGLDDIDAQYKHDLREGDHVIRWKMLGFCYPIQVHGIVFSAGPDFVTIVDCGLASDNSLDQAGNFEEQENKDTKRSRRRMDILTLVDENEIKKWTKINYGGKVQLKVHSSNEEMRQQVNDNNFPDECSEKTSVADIEESPSAGLELEEVEKCVQAKIKPTPGKSSRPSPKKSPSSWFSLSSRSTESAIPADVAESKSAEQGSPKNKSETLRLPKADPPILVLARLRFLLEYGGEAFPPPSRADANDNSEAKQRQANLLPPHHLLYANSECIAVFCKTGRWSTLQAAIFLHSSAFGNVKQSVTLAMFLSAQTVTVPASGFWGFFGGTTTVSLFAVQPWLVPALVGGGVVYVGLPMIMLWKAKGRWANTEKRLNNAFWSMCDSDVIVELIRCWSGLEG